MQAVPQLVSGFRLPALLLAAGLLLYGPAACGDGGGTARQTGIYDWNLPEGFPVPVVDPANPMSAEKAELGRHLFYDNRLSTTGAFSCASCHHPDKAFTDGLVHAAGATGQPHPRNSMALANVAYNTTFNWANPAVISLEVQAVTPLFGTDPVELGLSGKDDEIVALLRGDPVYRDLVPAAFPGEADPFTVGNVIYALASFERTLLSYNSPYDRRQRSEPGAMSESAIRGQELFFGERLECFHCHNGLNLGQAPVHTGTTFREANFQNNGLYNVGGTGDYPEGNRGLWDITHEALDMGKFKPPSLRNIELTAPYMHDGSAATLDDVLDHYARGGRLISSGPYAGDGALNPNKSIFMVGFTLTPQERDDIKAFLLSLTDWEFICRESIQDPFGNLPKHENCE